MSHRVGMGIDAHPFAPERTLRLGGVEIAGSAGLAGHSDGDVLLHAIADAILGAASLPSLGELFSDSDPAWKGADSARFLERAVKLAAAKGWRISNVDAVVIAEAPRIAPYAVAIRQRLASILSIEDSRVGIRGTSTNGLGFAGRGEGIAATAVVLLEGEA
ncbi:MAG TPA: 2-C-methyl-D-erythritol 2,4-cyclodiphosphate synthase [Thermoanaerobaculia bacterium]|nr:2-C-methyl-D-erythritol 2,4-cyclodiphosphate synthase [Thermoanaerobaculia bacterium]